jgi:hypothetical protein
MPRLKMFCAFGRPQGGPTYFREHAQRESRAFENTYLRESRTFEDTINENHALSSRI